MIGLRSVHALGVLPGDIPKEAKDGDHKGHEPEDGRGEETWDHSIVFGGEVKHRSDSAVDRNKGEPDDKTAWYSEESPFGPEVCDECRLAEDSDKNSGIERCTPDPMPGDLTIALWEIPKPDEF